MAKARRPAAKLSRGQRVIAFVEKYLTVPEGAHVGRKVKLRDWQRAVILKIYDGVTRRAIISFPRKNAKTSLAAMLVLAHLVGPEARRNAQIYSAAQSRDQAALVFGLAAKMARMSSALNELVSVRDSAKELFCPTTGVRYKALSADATTAYGLSPVLVIHDELGQVRGPRSELYEALETSMGAQEEPLSIVISTQAPTDSDLLSTLIDDATRSADDTVKLFLFMAQPDDDPWSEETWRKANPALGDFLSLDEIRKTAEVAKRLPAQEAAFRNLHLNQRVAAEDHFLGPAVWALNAGEADLAVLDDMPVYVGADLSATRDLTAIVAGAMDSAGIWHIRPWFFLPKEGLAERARQDKVPYDLWEKQGFLTATPGKTVDYDFVAGVVSPFLRPLDVRQVAYDRWHFGELQKAFARQGYAPPFLTDFGQGFKTMTPALRALETLALEGRLRHGNNPIMTMCAANCRVETDAAGNRKLTKKKSTGRIDGMVALAMVIGAASAQPIKAPSKSFWNSDAFLAGAVTHGVESSAPVLPSGGESGDLG